MYGIKPMLRVFALLILLSATGGCSLITTPVKVIGTAATTSIKTVGTVVSAPFKMAGDSEEE